MPSLAEYQGAVEILGRLWVCPPMTHRPRTALFAVVLCAPPDRLAFRIRGAGRRQWAYRQPEGE